MPEHLPDHLPTDDPVRLAACLSVTRLDLVLATDPRLDMGPDLVSQLRGAWGHELRRAAPLDPEAAR